MFKGYKASRAEIDSHLQSVILQKGADELEIYERYSLAGSDDELCGREEWFEILVEVGCLFEGV